MAGEASEAGRIGMWLFFAAETMLFGGLFVAYALIRMRHEEAFAAAHLELHRGLGLAATVAMLSGSLAMALAPDRFRRGWVALAAVCGAAFVAILGIEYASAIGRGLAPGQLFFGFFFVMTGLHGLHVLAGTAVLAWLAARGRAGSVELAGMFWHMLTLIWIFLFPLLYLAA